MVAAKLRDYGESPTADMTMMGKVPGEIQRENDIRSGYPACPDLTQQKIIFDLLHPQEIGVELTDQFMMDPEASVSAMSFIIRSDLFFQV